MGRVEKAAQPRQVALRSPPIFIVSGRCLRHERLLLNHGYLPLVYSRLHNAIAASSLTKICFPITTGCAYVALSATEYFATCSKPFALFFATIRLASLVRISSASFALRIAALAPSRPSVVHNTLPVAASRQKYWPLRFADIPNRWSPSSTGEFIYIAISGLRQTCFVVHSAPFLATWTAIVPLRTPEKISVFL